MERLTEQSQQRTAQQILDMLVQHRARLREFGVQKIGLFGSYSRGEAGLDSDMDFLVVLERLTFDDYMSVLFLLEDLFSCKVDLVLEDSIKPRLRPYIMSEVMYAPNL
ncbi:MAG TPA: nucleotidyltransferase family protein [Chloroflexia bacterium]|nr:nucleotidyltransferase family protein [Chloroflexia bacterium]